MTRQTTDLWSSWTRDRDERSFESLVLPELPHALGFARRLGCNSADADDAVQEALARLAAVSDDSPAAVGVRAWLCREVHVRARSRLRSERRRTARETAAAVAPSRELADSTIAARDEVEHALSGLDADERSAVELRYLHDLDYREMAVVLAASEGACRLRVHKALARLRARFGKDSAALVAALPLPAARDVSALVKGALAKATVVSTATGGAVVMATTAQKVMIAAVAAAALGVAGTLGVQRALAPDVSSTNVASAAATTSSDARPASRGAARATDAASAQEIESLKARIADLETRLVAASAKAADLDEMDPMAVLVYAKKPIGWKARKLLEIADEKQRWAAMGKVTTVLAERENTARDILEALKTETDPKVIDMIGKLARGSSLEKSPVEDRRAFVELLRSAPLPETRAASVNALFMNEGFRGGFDEKTKAVAKEMNGYLIEALRTESSPDVVGAIARNFDAWSPPPEAMDLLKAAADRLPASPGRRMVWEAIARGSMSGGPNPGLFQQFQAATAQDVKDDIAAGIARAGNSMSFGGGKPEEKAKRQEEARAKFRTVFGGTSDVAVRKSLLRAALYGLGCVEMGAWSDEQKADVVRFFRETSALEPDVKQREKIEKVAVAFEQKGMGAVSEFDRIMAAKD